jgi:N-methylhydantoinase A
VVPQNSSVFCALGLLAADFVLRYDQTVGWDLSKTDEVESVNEVADRMVAAGRSDMREEGFGEDDIEVQRSADFRFIGQAYELTMPLPDRSLSGDDAPVLAKQFYELYERTYGEGTAWQGVPELLLNYTVTVVGRQARPSMNGGGGEPRSAEDMLLTRREVYIPSLNRREEIPIYDDDRFTPGSKVEGPVIIDATDTTIYVPPETSATRDEFMNYVLSKE